MIRAAVFLIGIILLITTFHVPVEEVNNRISILAKKPRTKRSLSSFSVRDKVGIYGLNLMMGIFAFPIYPEVSRETLMLVFPSHESGIRTFKSDFALKSQKIKNVIKNFRNDLIFRQSENELNARKRISWTVSDYTLGSKEARYALALNPSNVSLQALKKDSFWIINVSIKVKISYPQSCYVTLLSKPALKVEEGLFWVLQQEGWLFPYTAEWKFAINSDDDRII